MLARFSWLIAALLPAAALAETPSVVAVFDIQDKSGKFAAPALEQLTDYLSAQMAEGGVFTVVPRAQIKAALQAQKAESYQQCYDDACQIEVGRELAAQRSLLTQVVQVGTLCAVTGTLYDLRRGASERAATKKASCDQDALVTALEAVAAALRGPDGAAVAAVAAAPEAATPEAGAAGSAGASAASSPPPDGAAKTSLTSSPVFWAIVSVVAVGAAVGVVVAVSTTGSDQVSTSGGALFRF